MINVSIEQVEKDLPIYDKVPGKRVFMGMRKGESNRAEDCNIIIATTERFFVPLEEANPEWLKTIAETISVSEQNGNKAATILIQGNKIGVYSIEE